MEFAVQRLDLQLTPVCHQGSSDDISKLVSPSGVCVCVSVCARILVVVALALT